MNSGAFCRSWRVTAKRSWTPAWCRTWSPPSVRRSGRAAEERRVILFLISISKKIKFEQYLIWVGLALVGLVIAGLVIAWLRRRMLGPDAQQAQAGLFDGLRAMRDRGELSLEEYETAKAAMVG